MNLIREWIVQIAGIIILGSLCDMIMPGGEMKKYVKLVVGLLLAFTVVKPIVNFSGEEFRVDIPQSTHMKAIEMQKSFDEIQQKEVLRLYKRNLAEKISMEIENVVGCGSEVEVEVCEKTNVNFGNIEFVSVVLDVDVETKNYNTVKQIIGEKFGVDEEKIEVKG